MDCHSGTSLSTQHYQAISPLAPCTDPPKQVSCLLYYLFFANDSVQTVSWMSVLPADSGIFLLRDLLTYPRDGKWIVVGVQQQHRKYCRGMRVTEAVRRKNKGGVIAVSAGEKYFSTRPLTIIKVQTEATARVYSSETQPDTEPTSWLVEAGWHCLIQFNLPGDLTGVTALSINCGFDSYLYVINISITLQAAPLSEIQERSSKRFKLEHNQINSVLIKKTVKNNCNSNLIHAAHASSSFLHSSRAHWKDLVTWLRSWRSACHSHPFI